MSTGPQRIGRRLAMALLLVLTAINFVNYLDRYVLSAVLEPIRTEFGLVDAESGLLGTMFMIVYTVAAPFGGYFGDRWKRKLIVAGGVFLWSLATIGSGLAESYETLLLMRATIGIGEAGYATVAPAIIADLFDRGERGRKLAYFYLAIPMGSALGYLIGGWVGEVYGWREAFYVAGVPGILLAGITLVLPEAPRGMTDDGGAEDRLMPVVAGLRRILRSPAWRINTVGTTLMTFAMGGIAFWMPSFLVRSQGLSLGAANTTFGALTVVAGLIGTLVGGYLGDRAFARGQGGYFKVSGMGLLIGAPFALVAPMLPSPTLIFAAIFVAELLLFLNTGPLNAALVGCVPPRLRATAVAVNVFFIHALGDAISPYVMGWISDQRTLALAISLTAVPIAVGGLALLVGARFVTRLRDGLLAVDGANR